MRTDTTTSSAARLRISLAGMARGRVARGRPCLRAARLGLGLALAAACAPPPPETRPEVERLATEFLYEEVDVPPDSVQLAEVPETNEAPYLLLGTVVVPDSVIEDGGVWIEDGVIQAVWSGSVPDSLDGITTISTSGVVLPGLIDLHNHVAYNFLPFWDAGETFENRYEWQDDSAYRNAVSVPYNAAKSAGLREEMNKFGEIRALVGGTTSILGAMSIAGTQFLVRNIDQATLGGDRMRTHVGSVLEFGCSRGSPLCPEQEEQVEGLRQQLAAGSTIAFHVAEGRDTLSREEFRWLEDNGLLLPGVLVTHATALDSARLQQMADAGMAMIWSPRSNIELYGRTAIVDLAHRLGVRIALAPDWSPSGSDNLLAELRFARQYDEDELGGAFEARELVQMATSTPAEIAKRGDRLGRVAVERRADLLVLERVHADPYRSIVSSDERHVRLVTVNGVPLYGFPSWLERLGKTGDFEVIRIRGRNRGLDATAPAFASPPKGDQRFDEIRAALEEAYEPFGAVPALTANSPGG